MVRYNAAIRACVKGAKLHQVFDVGAAMMRQARKPDVVISSARRRACETGKEMLGHSASVR